MDGARLGLRLFANSSGAFFPPLLFLRFGNHFSGLTKQTDHAREMIGTKWTSIQSHQELCQLTDETPGRDHHHHFQQIPCSHLSLLAEKSLPEKQAWTRFVSMQLSRFSGLKFLDISGCGLRCDHVSSLLGSLQHHSIHLESLLLGGNQIGNRCAQSIADYISFDPELRLLYLRFNNIGDEGMAPIAHALSYHKTIRTLNMAHNQISNKGMKQLCNGLLMNHSLEQLTLSGNFLFDSQSSLSDYARHSTRLKLLGLSNCKLGGSAQEPLRIQSTSIVCYEIILIQQVV